VGKLASHPRGGVHEQAGRNSQTGIYLPGRALLDSERKNFWLAKAEEWEQRALEEIAFHFKECNRDSADCQTAA